MAVPTAITVSASNERRSEVLDNDRFQLITFRIKHWSQSMWNGEAATTFVAFVLLTIVRVFDEEPNRCCAPSSNGEWSPNPSNIYSIRNLESAAMTQATISFPFIGL